MLLVPERDPSCEAIALTAKFHPDAKNSRRETLLGVVQFRLGPIWAGASLINRLTQMVAVPSRRVHLLADYHEVDKSYT